MTDLNLLLAPFAPNEHKFNYDGFAYIDETAITERLDLTCGLDGYAILQPHEPQQVTQMHYIATVELSILTQNGWISRTGTGEGTQAIPKPKNGDDPLDNPRFRATMGENAPKGAATDALRRAARLWGMGRYLLSMPKNDYNKPTITDERALETWMFNTGLIYQIIGKSNWWRYLKDDAKVKELYNHDNHLVNALRILSEDVNMDTVSYDTIRQLLIERKQESAA